MELTLHVEAQYSVPDDAYGDAAQVPRDSAKIDQDAFNNDVELLLAVVAGAVEDDRLTLRVTPAGADPIGGFLDWLIAMDDPANAEAARERQTVTLTKIIEYAKEVRGG